MKTLSNFNLTELTKEQCNLINGGGAVLIDHFFRAISFSALGAVYWLGYAVGKAEK